MIMRLAPLFAFAVSLAACAQAAGPPGGEPDRYAPLIVSTLPDTNAVAADFNGEVIIRFDETLSERGIREDDMVLVSPETGEVDVDRKGDELRIELEGGWRRGIIYHIIVMPGIQDRFGNARSQAYELVFSTGPTIPLTALAGVVVDRLTARTVANARVLVSSTIDSTTYVTLTDTAGFFAMRSLPLGTYNATAYLDMNRNRKIDFPEPLDVKGLSLLAAGDTPVVELAVLAPDTTPARLLRAEARDTTSVRIAFDDFIPAYDALAPAAATLWQLPDSTPGPTGVLMRVREYDAQTAARDTTKAAPPVAAAPPPNAIGAADTVRLPSQDLIFVPTRPLTPATRYRIFVSGIRNMVGLTGGGGTITFETAARPRPAAPRDSTAAPRDTTAVRPAVTDTTPRR